MVDFVKNLASFLDLDERVEGVTDRRITRRHLEDLIIKQYQDTVKFPRRQRSLNAIHDGLGGFLRDPQVLKEYLMRMKAEPVPNSGEGMAQEWHLSPEAEKAFLDGRPRPLPLRRLVILAAVLTVLVLVIGTVAAPGEVRGWLAGIFNGGGYASKAECLAGADGNFRRISECERLFP